MEENNLTPTISEELIIRPSLVYHLKSLNLQVNVNIGEAGGTFGLSRTGQVIWNGSYLLCQILEYIPPCSLINCRILELGCGCCALPGQIAAVLGGIVTLTDVSSEISTILENIKINSLIHIHPINVCELDWINIYEKRCLPEHINPIEFDLILCADVVYELTLIPFMYTLVTLLQNNPNLTILMSNEGRKHVHLFRRKMLDICYFQEITPPTNDYHHCITWIIKLKESPNWESIDQIFE